MKVKVCTLRWCNWYGFPMLLKKWLRTKVAKKCTLTRGIGVKNKKWINMDKLFVLMYELCSDEVRESFGKRSNNVKDILLCEEDIKQ